MVWKSYPHHDVDNFREIENPPEQGKIEFIISS